MSDNVVVAAEGRGPEAGRVAIRVELDRDGSMVAPNLSSSGILTARLTPWGVWIVGAGAHPIGGDALSIGLSLGPSASLDVRSTGATIARPGAHDATSTTAVVADVESKATLRWLVEPGMAVAGGTHVAQATVRLAASARLLWRDEVVLGRFGEGPGTWSTGIRVERMGRPVVDVRLGVGPGAPGWKSSAVLHGSRALVGLVVVDPGGYPAASGARWIVETDARGTVSHSEGSPVAQITSCGHTLDRCRAVAARLLGRLEPPAWVGDIW